MKRFSTWGMGALLAVIPLVQSAFGLESKGDSQSPSRQRPVQWVSSGERVEYLPGLIIVKLRPEVGRIKVTKRQGIAVLGISSLDAKLQKYEVTKVERIFPHHSPPKDPRLTDLSRFYHLTFPTQYSPLEVAREFAQDPYVEYAEPSYVRYTDETPNDPLFSQQVNLAVIKAAQAWDVGKGDSSVVIGIIDSGVDLDHPDLAANIWINADEIPNNGLDDDNNGFVDDVRGWDFIGPGRKDAQGNIIVEPDNDPDPKNGNPHGTVVAGIASAVTNNGVGVAGVGWGCRLLVTKHSIEDPASPGIFFGYSGIVYAADNGAHVINMSWGGGSYSQFEQEVVNYAYEKGAIVVAAAGNDPPGQNYIPPQVPPPHYPSGYDHVLSVAATDNSDRITDWTLYGPTVDLSAPGVEPLSTVIGGGYSVIGSGTSFSSPVVAGVAALVRTQHPEWTNDQVASQVIGSTDNIDAVGLNRTYVEAGGIGSGRVNAFKALTVTPQPKLALTRFIVEETAGGNGNGLPDPGETFNLQLVLNSLWGDATHVVATLASTDYAVTISDGFSSFGDIPGGARGVDNRFDLMTFSIQADALPHRIAFTLDLAADGGYSERFPIEIALNPAILLVDDDDGGNNVEGYYTSALDSLGFVYDVWSHVHRGTPAGLLSNYPTVIWLCEWTFPALDAIDRAEIAQYLDSGGHLFISGQDIGWDLNDPAADNPYVNEYKASNGTSKVWYETYLHARYLADDSDFSSLTGVPGDPIGDGLAFDVYQPGRGADEQFPSEITPLGEATTIFQYPNGKAGAVKFAGTHRVVHFAFGGYEAIVQADVRAQVMPRVLDWLNGLTVEHTPLKDTEDTVHDHVVRVKITSTLTPIVAAELYWDTDGEMPFHRVPLTDEGGGVYSARIPSQGMATFQYFFFVKAANGFYSPMTLHSFTAGPDTIAPTFVSVEKLPHTFDKRGPYTVSARIDDNLGVDTSKVYLHFQVNSGPVDSLRMIPQGTAGLFEVDIADSFAYGDTISYFFTAQDLASVPNRAVSQANRFVIGLEDFESGLTLWQTEPGGWGLETLYAHSGKFSVNESPGAPYGNNLSTSLTLSFGLDLSSAPGASLFFWNRYFFEANKDFGYVEVSVDSGRTWTVLEPAITGVKALWREERRSLTPYTGPGFRDVRLRFRVATDGTQAFRLEGWFVDDVRVVERAVVSVREAAEVKVPKALALAQNYPNPFNPITTIAYQLPKAAEVRLEVYNLLGQRVKTLVDERQDAGFYRVSWDGKSGDGREVSSGVYIYRLRVDAEVMIRKMLLLR